MIKRILVPLDSSAHTRAAVDYAARIARENHAILEGIVVIEHFTKGVTEDRTVGLLEWFADRCNELGVPHTEAKAEGVPAREILEEALTYDLIVSGQRTHFHTRKPGEVGDSLARMLGDTTCPILAVPARPDGSDELPDINRVLIAYDGSPNASRALRAFAAMAEALDDPEITILNTERTEEDGKEIVERAAAYLRSYRFNRIETRVEPRGRILDLFRAEYRNSCDLVVCGTHAKTNSLITDFFIGGFTLGLLDDDSTPILFAH